MKKFFLPQLLLISVLLIGCKPQSEIPVSPTSTLTPEPIVVEVIAGYDIPQSDDLTITYIGIEGVLITIGETKIMIDGLHDFRVPETLQEDMVAGVPPFDNLDLLLVTHNHSDHFNVEMVGDYLMNNPETVLLSTTETRKDLQTDYPSYEIIAERIEALDPMVGESLMANLHGINIEVFNIPHGINVPVKNNGYLVDLAGVKVFHSGDAAGFPTDYLVEYGFSEKGIDIYLFSWQYLAGDTFLMEDAETILNGRYYFPLHDPAPDVVLALEEYDGVIFFEDALDYWVFEE